MNLTKTVVSLLTSRIILKGNNSKIIASILDFNFNLTIGLSIVENHENDIYDENLAFFAAAILDSDFDLTIGFSILENHENDSHDE